MADRSIDFSRMRQVLTRKEKPGFSIPRARMVLQGYNPDQPRDPKGSSTGGQWTKSSPDSKSSGIPYTAGQGGIIEDVPGSFAYEYQLEDIPDEHLDGLKKIGFVEHQFIQTIDASGQLTEAYGIYNPKSQVITLSNNKDNISVIGGNTLAHEVGHHVHLYKMTEAGAAEWARISKNGTSASISAYARTNQGEHFAEAYRAYMMGGNKRKSLKALEPQSYKFMRNLNKYILPVGEYANVDGWIQRYEGR